MDQPPPEPSHPQQALPEADPRPRQETSSANIVLIVVAVVVIFMVAAVVGTAAFIFVLDKPDHARWEAARSDMAQIHQALSKYRVDNGHYPASLADLRHKYFPSGVPQDPFANTDFVYRRTDNGYLLTCYGKDQAAGGREIPNRDIQFNESGEVRE